jgi:GntR family transcriptional repressor for pyruvate dehydrogenase complex
VTTSSFHPVSRQTVSAEIRQRIADAIESGKFAPGEPLPAERVLCLEFGVARTSVREAIQGLVIAGYVERRGNRSVVAERLPDVNFTGDDRKALVTQLFEVRQVIEPAIVEMATRRATDEQRAEIASIAATNTKQVEHFRELDHQFHSALARACGNPLLNEVHSKALASLFGSGDMASLLYAEVNRAEVGEIISSSLAAHRAIAEAVVRGHSRKAVAAVVAHLDDVERRMVERLL